MNGSKKIEELTIVIFKTDEGEYQYDIFDQVNCNVDAEESLDGGVCETTIKNALEMAVDQALLIIDRDDKYYQDNIN